jgi:hypothetical protein
MPDPTCIPQRAPERKRRHDSDEQNSYKLHDLPAASQYLNIAVIYRRLILHFNQKPTRQKGAIAARPNARTYFDAQARKLTELRKTVYPSSEGFLAAAHRTNQRPSILRAIPAPPGRGRIDET